MGIKTRVEDLRKEMAKYKLDAYIIPSADDHLSEYVPDHFKSREWISGFTGSAGTVVITMKEAGLWTDGRYYIQAKQQLKNSGIDLFRAADPGIPSYSEWLKKQIHIGGSIGIDGSLFSVANVSDLQKSFGEKGIGLNTEHDLISALWIDRPAKPKGKAFIHKVEFAGKARAGKIYDLRKEMKKAGANRHLLTSLDDIAWLLNIRGSDVPNNPVVICSMIVNLKDCLLYIENEKITEEVRAELESDGIAIQQPGALVEFLANLSVNDGIMLDPEMTNYRLYNAISKNCRKILTSNITTKKKAIKNRVEIQNLKKCQVNDGIAMVRFIKWLKSNLESEKITEISAAERLEVFRKRDALFNQPSFDTIAAYKDHAAMMHYKATEGTDKVVEPKGLLLIDSGGQYLNGTTDITRTLVLGELTEEQRRDFTLVLKGHIALASARFLEGTNGHSLDILARGPLWKEGLDYKCGTGHGVGFFLNVHEGPQRISRIPNTVPIEAGMILTNEPGIYKEGKYGIRTENMMLVKPDRENEYGRFLKFETLTWCPIDIEGISVEMLTDDEIQWLNEYHEKVYRNLSPYLAADEKKWLKEATRKLKQHQGEQRAAN